MSDNWRDRFRPLIAKVLAENDGKPEGELRQALRDAFPQGPRKYWPYKVWLDEIRVQRGMKTDRRIKKGERRAVVSLPGQIGLFTEQPAADVVGDGY